MAQLTHQDVQDIIEANTAEILDMFELSVSLRAALKQENVITAAVADKLKVGILTEHEKIQEILTSISKRGKEPFVKFCQVLSEKDHPHVLEVLGVVVQGNTITVRKVSGQQVQMQIGAGSGQLAAGPTYCAGAASMGTPLAGLPSGDELDKLFKKKLRVFKKLAIDSDFMLELTSAEVITDSMVQIVNSKPTNTDKVQELMTNQLPKRGAKSKQMFLKCLLESDQVHLLEEIGLPAAQIEQLKHLE